MGMGMGRGLENSSDMWFHDSEYLVMIHMKNNFYETGIITQNGKETHLFQS